MTSTNKRASTTGTTPNLRHRADATKASAKRVVRRDLADQPSLESLPGGSPVDRATGGFTGRGEPRHFPAQGLDEKQDRGGADDRRQSAGETDMGRHESFATATPINDELLSGTRLGRHSENEAEPTASPDRRALVAYASWLYHERSQVCRELYPHLGWQASTFVVGQNAGFDYHGKDTPAPSTRAQSVLSLVECDWRQDSYLGIGDDKPPAPSAAAFPHPDARLMDLGNNFFTLKTAAAEASRIEEAAHEEFERREESFADADKALLQRQGGSDHWDGLTIRQILSGRYKAKGREAELIDDTPRAAFERLLPLAEARDARREALTDELNISVVQDASESLCFMTEKAAELVYRMPAHSFAGLALKARVLQADRPELWKRPSFFTNSAHADWHEIALTEIADSVEHLITVGGHSAETKTGPSPMIDVVNDDGTVTYSDAAGKLWTHTVEHWIAFQAQRLFSIASRTMNERYNAACTGLGEGERYNLDSRLRRELRTDALFALAFRPREVFAAAEAKRRGDLSDEAGVDHG